jgi:hypothetical protein
MEDQLSRRPNGAESKAGWFKSEVEDSVMALISAQEPARKFTPGDVSARENAKFNEAVKYLCRLGCRRRVLYYCLGRVKFGPAPASTLPNIAAVRSLAKSMGDVANKIERMEQTGLLDPLDEREGSGDTNVNKWAERIQRFRTLPAALRERATTYTKWAELLSERRGSESKNLKLRRDLLSRVNRLSLSVYAKFATNKSKRWPALVEALMRSAGVSADKSQLVREVEQFEGLHFQTEQFLQDKLRSLHDKASRRRGK